MNLYSIIECQSANELLTELSLLEGDEWYFRGHCDEAYRLIPTLWRTPETDGLGGFEIDKLYKKFCGLTSEVVHQRILNSIETSVSLSSPGLEHVTKERVYQFLLRVRFEYYLLHY